MDRDRNNHFPTGWGDGGGRRSFEGAWGFSTENNSESGHHNFDDFFGYLGGARNTMPRNSEENIFSWIHARSNGVDGLRNNGRDVAFDPPSTSSEPEFRTTPNYVGHNTVNYVQYEIRQGIFKCSGFASFASFGFPVAQTAIAYNVAFPAQGQAGVGVRLYQNQAAQYNVGVHNNIGGLGMNGVGVNGGLIGAMFAVGRGGYENSPQNNNEKLVRYTTDCLNALQNRDGDRLADLLSVRDRHIFHTILSLPQAEVAGTINLICNNRDLVEALVTHIDCVKALAGRNIPLSFYKQTACVNAVMRLLHEPYQMREDWANTVLLTVTYELNVISSRMPSFAYHTGIVIRYSLVVTNIVCVFHPPACQCNIPRVPGPANFQGPV